METVELNRAFWLDRPTFVTGGTGLLGSWLTQRLIDAGADVTCLIRESTYLNGLARINWADKVRIIRGDLSNLKLLKDVLSQQEITTVLHTAAQAIVTSAVRNPVPTFEANIAGTWNIMEACRLNPKVGQIVVASSDKAYGNQETLPYTEEMPLLGQQPYELSKAVTDLIAQTYATTYNLPVAITRCGNFYGGGDLNWNRIIPGTIRAILQRQRPIIRSDGEFIRDYFYVEDGAAVYMLLAEQLAKNPKIKGQAFNFSNEIQLSVREIVNLILQQMGSGFIPDIRNEPSNEIRYQYLSSEKARRELRWKPMFDLEEGLRKTIEWYKEYFKNE